MTTTLRGALVKLSRWKPRAFTTDRLELIEERMKANSITATELVSAIDDVIDTWTELGAPTEGDLLRRVYQQRRAAQANLGHSAASGAVLVPGGHSETGEVFMTRPEMAQYLEKLRNSPEPTEYFALCTHRQTVTALEIGLSRAAQPRRV